VHRKIEGGSTGAGCHRCFLAERLHTHEPVKPVIEIRAKVVGNSAAAAGTGLGGES
jgi:hypothetical protein